MVMGENDHNGDREDNDRQRGVALDLGDPYLSQRVGAILRTAKRNNNSIDRNDGKTAAFTATATATKARHRHQQQQQHHPQAPHAQRDDDPRVTTLPNPPSTIKEEAEAAVDASEASEKSAKRSPVNNKKPPVRPVDVVKERIRKQG